MQTVSHLVILASLPTSRYDLILSKSELLETADLDVLAEKGNLRLDIFFNSNVGIAQEGLVHQAPLSHDLLNASGNDLGTDFLWFLRKILASHLNLPFFGQHIFWNLSGRHKLHTRSGGDLHSQVVHDLLELFTASNEVRFAVDLDENTDVVVVMNVGANEAISSFAGRLLVSAGNAFLTKKLSGLFHRSSCFFQSLLAVHHSRSRLITELLHNSSGNSCSHFHGNAGSGHGS
mmetsp:Transcript_22993/g.39483  ORF Transcript_22993/g.39483 Transcript_22993/m.39483 type:complete len:233 (-) Transcript_22993:261-959(-)